MLPHPPPGPYFERGASRPPDDLFDSVALLPAQVPSRRRFAPEQRLLAAILEDALHCATSPMAAARFGTAARQWIFSQRRSVDPSWWDFVTICEHLGVDPAAMREVVRSRDAQPRPLCAPSTDRAHRRAVL